MSNETAVAEPVVKAAKSLVATGPASLIQRVAARFHVEPGKMMHALKSTAFRSRPGDPEITNEQMLALLVVADQHGLNPWTKEIYAFPDKSAGIVPVVGVDGWSRIVNEHPQYDGVEFAYGEPVDKHKGAPAWIECAIFRKDRTHPTRIREHLSECYLDTAPWKSHPGRMLRHKAFMQCARVALSFVGIYDEDEAARIVEGESFRVQDDSNETVANLNAKVAPKPANVIDAEPPRETATDGEKATPDAKPDPTFTADEVRAKLDAAANLDDVADARSLIGAVADEAARADLTGLADRRAFELGGDQ